MGICNSCEATAVIAATMTTKLIMEDGSLEEFKWPVKASKVLHKQQNNVFICSADDMEFNTYVRAVENDEELQLGQLYFVLPVCMLRLPLHSEDMAALAVKASAALAASARACGSDKRAVAPVPIIFPAVEECRQRRRRGAKGRRRFAAELIAIPE